MDPNFPKNEREWWAAEEITRLRADVASLTAQLQSGESFHAVAVRQRDAAWKEIEALRAENHNLNWALGTPGYNTMATPAEQAEHEAAVARIDAVLARMEKAKEEHAAMTADAERYRFMDEHCGIVDMISDPDNLVQVWVAEQRYCGSTLDAAIDAARAAKGERG